jgi:hypothetical protein
MLARWLRLALALALGVGLAVLVLGASCQTPTQIVVEVRSNACPNIESTNIAVATTDAELEAKAEPKAAKSRCDSDTTIGTLVLVPEGNDDREVILRVLTGVTRSADNCAATGNDGCIVAKRRVRFVPDEIVHVTIDMNRVCLGKDCGAESSCDETTGECIAIPCAGPECKGPAGDAGARDSGADHAVTDARVDAPPDVTPPKPACNATNCGSGGKSCDGGTCVVDCLFPGCNGVVCPPGIPCAVRCLANCSAISCGKATACTIDCFDEQSCSSSVDCGEAASCTVRCANNSGCNGDVNCSSKVPSTCNVTCGLDGCKGKVHCCKANPCTVTGSGTMKDPECK